MDERTAQQEGLTAVGPGAQPGFDPVAHLVPVPHLGQLAAPPLDLAPRDPDQVTAAGSVAEGVKIS